MPWLWTVWLWTEAHVENERARCAHCPNVAVLTDCQWRYRDETTDSESELCPKCIEKIETDYNNGLLAYLEFESRLF